MNASTAALKVYYCYAEEDEDLRNQLTAHLSPLRRERKLTIWLDVLIQAGSDWKLEVERHLKEADLILLLISSGFMASDYCYNLQLTAALNHYEAGKVEIIPILLRPVLWEETPIKQLPLILPTSKLPVTRWPDRDEALKNVASAIRDLIQMKLLSNRSVPVQEMAVLNQFSEPVLVTQCPQCGTANRIGARFCKNDGTDLVSDHMSVVPKPIPSLQTKEMWVEEGQTFASQKRHADALASYEQALLLDPHFATAYFYKGHVLYSLQQYPVALAAYEQAIRYSPTSAAPHCHRGHTLRHLQRYPEALIAYEQAIRLGSPEIGAAAYDGKRCVYEKLGLEEEAKASFAKAVSLNPALYK